MNPQQHQRGAAAGDNLLFYEPHQVGAMVVSGVKRFASRHPLSPAGFVAGLVGIIVGDGTALLAYSQQFKQYDQIMNTIDLQARPMLRVITRELIKHITPQGMVLVL
jgi:hypothetical protein